MSDYHYFHPIEVRYGDLDPQGHVNNAKFLTYIEQARVSYVHHLGLWDGGSFFDIGFILADLHISYKQPIHFGVKVHVGVRVSKLGNKSLVMEYILKDSVDRDVLATAESIQVAYDYHTQQTIVIPEIWRKTITAFEHEIG